MATSVDEIILRYKSDISDLQAKAALIQNQLRQTQKASDDTGKKISEGFKKGSAGANEFNTALKNIKIPSVGDQLAGLGNRIVAAFAVSEIINFGVQAEKAFLQAEKSAQKLRSAVGISGGLTSDFERLVEQSKELQKITVFSDETTQDVQSAALQFGLVSDEVQRIIPLVADFAAATGQDLRSALDNVLRGIEGQSRGLKLYGITVSESATRAENFDSIVAQLSTKFEGQAQTIAAASGQAEIYNNRMNDIQETIGAKVSPKMNQLRELFLSIADTSVDAIGHIGEALPILDAIFANFDPVGFIASKAEQSVREVQKVTAQAKLASAELIEKFKKDFESIDSTDLQKKLVELSAAYKKNREDAKGLNAETGQDLNKQSLELAAQILAINAITKARREGTAVQQQSFDLEKASTAELEKRIKFLESQTGFRNKDEIEAIKKEIEERKKAGEQITSDRQKFLDLLHELEKTASEENLKLKASEVDKIARLEQEKQIKLKNLVEAFAKSQGAPIDDLLRKFDDTGIIDLEEALKRIEKTKPPVSEMEAFRRAIDNTKQSADLLKDALLDQGRVLSFTNQLKDAFDFIDKQVKQTAQNIENEFTDKKIKIQTELSQKGTSATPKDFKAANDEIIKLDRDKEKALLDNAKAGTAAKKEVQQNLNNQLQRLGSEHVLDNKELIDEDVQNTKKGNDIIIKDGERVLEAEERLAQQRKALRVEIAQTLAEGFVDNFTASAQRRADIEIENINRVRDAEIESIDERLEANEKRFNNDIITAKEFNQTQALLLAQRKQVEDRAEARERQLKRQQFEREQRAAVSKVVIANIINAAQTPQLTALYAALAIAQTAIILSEPNPYKKGSKKTKEGLAIVGEEGPELVQMPAKAKVLPADKTKKHSEMIDAMFDNRMDDHVQKVYVEPALQKQKKITLSKEFVESNQVLAEIINNVNGQERSTTFYQLLNSLISRVNVDREINSHLYERISDESLTDRISSSIERLVNNVDKTTVKNSAHEFLSEIFQKEKFDSNTVKELVRTELQKIRIEKLIRQNKFSISDTSEKSVNEILKDSLTREQYKNYTEFLKDSKEQHNTVSEFLKSILIREKSDSALSYKQIVVNEILKNENLKEATQKNVLTDKISSTVRYIIESGEDVQKTFNSLQTVITKVKEDNKNEQLLSSVPDEPKIRQIKVNPLSSTGEVQYKELLLIPVINEVMARLDVAPTLKVQQTQHERDKRDYYAQSVANSFSVKNIGGGLSANDYANITDEQRMKGNYVRNLQRDVTNPIIETLESLLKKESYKR